MKKQDLMITIIDRRTNPSRKRVKRFVRHQDYLKAMGRLMNLPGAHLHERTDTTVTIYPEKTIPDLFE